MTENTDKDIGTLLKDQREKLGYSLQDAAQHTRIRITALESIENNQFSDLPGQVYVTGFIKVYANYLGVDSAPLLRLLEEIRPSDGPQSVKAVSVFKHQSERFGKSSTGAGWRVFLFGVMVVLIIAAAVYFLLPLFQAENPAKVTPNQVVPEKESSVQGSVEATREATGEVDKTQQNEIVPVPGAESVPAIAEMASTEANTLPPVSPDGSSLRMLALSEGSLTIYLDDREPDRYKLIDGLDLTWEIKSTAKVELSGPGMARFWLDSQELELGDLETFQLQPASGD
ncbi:MAG: helix-turn-helix domain-containing protein [Desulfuromonadales bacterium]